MIKKYFKNQQFIVVVIIIQIILFAFTLGLQINLKNIKENQENIQQPKKIPVINPDGRILQDQFYRLPKEDRIEEKI